MSEKEVQSLDRCYAVLTEGSEENWYKAAERLTKDLGRIVARNLRAGQGAAKPHSSDLGKRQEIEADLLQQVRNEVEDAILLYAPLRWSDERCEEVEEDVMTGTKTAVSASSTQELRSTQALQHHIKTAVAETKRRLQGRR
jgi:hypothetical protein